jgi:Winged helix DNA-binding domain
VDRARVEERSIVRTWAMRGTIHLLAAEDAGWLLPLFDRSLAADSRRRLAQLGMDARAQDRALAAVRRELETDGFAGRTELVARLGRVGIEIDASRRVHLFRLATAEGIAILGPDRGSETLLAPAREWLGERPPSDRDVALAELGRRYVRAFGPATEGDFAGWAGLPLRDVRAGLSRIAGELAEVEFEGVRAWALRRGAPRARGRIVRLLPAWDNCMMGHRDRLFFADEEAWRRITPGGGLIRPTIVVDGVAAGTWSLLRKGRSRTVELQPFADVDDGTQKALEAEVADIERFEG